MSSVPRGTLPETHAPGGTVPRGTLPRSLRQARLSVRVPYALKAVLREAVNRLQARGLRTSESELVELLVEQGVSEDIDTLERRLRRWRTEREQR